MQRRINRTHSVLPALLPAIACAAMLAAVFAMPGAHAMNKCVDENGHMIYTDARCPEGSKKKEVSSTIKSAEGAGDPEAIVAQADAAIAEGNYEKLKLLQSRASREKWEKDVLQKGGNLKESNEFGIRLFQAMQPTNIKLIDVKYLSATEAVVRQEGIGRMQPDPQIGTTTLVKEAGGWKIKYVSWDFKK